MTQPVSRTIPELLLEISSRAPNAPAIITDNARVDYGELVLRAARVADYLRDIGVGRGDRVGLLCSNCVEWLEIFFGITATGAIVVPFSTWSTRAELDFLLKDSGASVVFTADSIGTRDFADDFSRFAAAGSHAELRRIIVIGSTDANQVDEACPIDSFRAVMDRELSDDVSRTGSVESDDVLVILYTSGSSNRPKAVPLLHGDAIENGFNIGERQGLGESDRVLIAIPLFWSYGAINALPATITHGAAMVLQDRFEAAGALDLIERHRCTALYTLPAMTNALLSVDSFSPERTASLRTGVTIGAPQDIVKVAEQLGARDICNIYGSTETYGNCCVTPHDWSLKRRAACQGLPLPGVTLRIRDGDSGLLAEGGSVGDIEVKGYITPGYDGHSAQHNETTFTKDGFFRTGDLGSVNAEGVLCYAGRRSEMIKRSGINVSPAEVEETLQQHASVGLAGVTGVEDEVRGEVIVAYVTLKADQSFDQEMLFEHCRSQLSRYKIPDYLVVCKSMPLTVTGKLMRRELKELATRYVHEAELTGGNKP